jgi:outer membrane protein
MQNWSIKAAQYNVQSARQIVHQQFAGHLPTVSIQGQLSRQYTDNINGYNSPNLVAGPGTTTERQFLINIAVPVFAGGGVVAQTNQAR